jgi:predicted nucleic acid-binding protein
MVLVVLFDTMEIIELLASQIHSALKEAIEKRKVNALISAISLTEIYKILGRVSEEEAKRVIRKIITSDLALVEADYRVCAKAGELKLHYNIPTADALIAATGIVSNATHILTTDVHFQVIKKLIKPVTIKEIKKIIK